MDFMFPPREIIQRVFALSHDKETAGSCLAVPINGMYYLITASHLIKELTHAQKTCLYLLKNNEWTEITAIPFFAEERNLVDIAVLKTTILAENTSNDLELSMKGAIIGQDTYFLGFPFFNPDISHKAQHINEGFPIPFIKKGTLSATQQSKVFIDGHNNPGFSGGPIIFHDAKTRKFKILGIITGYLTQEGKIKNTISPRSFYEENSGIAVGYNINVASDLIDRIENGLLA